MLHDGAQHGLVGGEAGHADASPLEITRAPHIVAACDHGRERPLDQRAHPHDVAARLARQPQVVDVHHRHVGPAGGEQLQRVGALAGHADLQAALVDARVDPIRLEVERERALGRAARVVAAAPRQQRKYRNQGKESAHGGEEYGRT